MAFTRASGRHRRTVRTRGTTAHLAGTAGLATAGAVGSLAAPAVAAPAPGPASDGESGGLARALVAGESVAVSMDVQAETMRAAVEDARARRQAEEARKEAAAAAEQKAAAQAAREREERERARRAAERTALGRHVAPVSGASLATAYGASGAAWSSGSHTGVDFHAPTGTTVVSVAAGEVVEAGWAGSYGYNVVIRHQDGRYTQYGHLSAATVAVGGSVEAGERIGVSGSTGNSTGPHLHFEVRTGPDYGSDIDPLGYLRSHGVTV